MAAKAKFVEHLHVHTVQEGGDGVTLILTPVGESVYNYDIDDTILDEVEDDMDYVRSSYRHVSSTLVLGDNLARMLYEHLRQYYG